MSTGPEAEAEAEAEEKVWYDANCHCGAVKYQIQLPNLDTHQVISCNCSICTKNGYVLVYPAPREVVFHSGYDTLKDYRFGKKRFDHKFCPVCASSILIDFHNPERWAVNARMIKNIEMDKLSMRYFDGMHKFEPEYNPDEMQ